jgi:hypothetical protein
MAIGITRSSPSAENNDQVIFTRLLSTTVDAYLAGHSNIHGVLIHAKSFPGWDSFAGCVAHIRFVRDHHQKVERVALVTDSAIARVAEALANRFTAAEIKYFPFEAFETALAWLRTP